MASGEIDFDGARAQLVGELDAGFKIMVTAMLNTSRWLNAVGDVGIMRRAYLEASSYAAERTAFGGRIGDFLLVRRQLAEIKAEWLAALHSTWELTALDETEHPTDHPSIRRVTPIAIHNDELEVGVNALAHLANRLADDACREELAQLARVERSPSLDLDVAESGGR